MSRQTRTQRLQHAYERLAVLQQEQVTARAAYEALAFGREVRLQIGTVREMTRATPQERKAVQERWLVTTRRVAEQERRIANMEGASVCRACAGQGWTWVQRSPIEEAEQVVCEVCAENETNRGDE